MDPNIVIDGVAYSVVHSFGDARVIINYEGLYVFADKNPDGTWDLSGEPARENEKPVLEALLAPTMDQTIVTVTKNE